MIKSIIYINWESKVVCRAGDPPTLITSTLPLTSLLPGDTISSGSMVTQVTQATGGNGKWTGEGFMHVPFMGVKVHVTFKNITINDKNQVTQGRVVSVYNPGSDFIIDLGGNKPDTTAVPPSPPDTTTTVTLPSPIDTIVKTDTGDILVITENGDTTTVQISPEGKITVIGPTGETTPIKGDEVTIVEPNGNTTVIDREGNIVGQNPNVITNNDSTLIKNYFLIKGRKFFDGATVYIPKSKEKITIEAFKSDDNSFPDTSKWIGINGVKSKAIYDISNISTSAKGINIKVQYFDTNNTLISISINVVVVEIKYSEPISINYGYDDNLIAQYPSYSTTPKKGINWKSVESNGTMDYIAVEIIPSGVERNVKFILEDSINFSVTPKIPTASIQNISVSGFVDKSETVLKPKIGCFISDSMQIKIKSFDMVKKELVVILVNEQNDDIQMIPFNQGKPNTPALTAGNNLKIDSNPSGDDVIINDTLTTGINGICETLVTGDDIQLISIGNGQAGQIGVALGVNKFLDTQNIYIGGDDQIIIQNGNEVGISVGIDGVCETTANNKDVTTTNVSITDITNRVNELYKQGVVEWDVDQTIITKTINFDLNRDDLFDVSSWVTAEMQVVIDSCKTNDNKYNLFLVDNPHDGSLGFMQKPPNRFGFIHPKKSRSPSTTCAHELGHGAFGLQHPFVEFRSQGFVRGGTDILNIMNYGSALNKFRKYQWDQMHK